MNDKPLSRIAHIILLVIQDGKRTSFNQLRRIPKQLDGFNPRTLSKQLNQLEKRRLIQKTPKKVRGGKQYSYTLTQAGIKWLKDPTYISRTYYDSIVEMIAGQMLQQHDLESKLWATDMIQTQRPAHTLNLTAELILPFGTRKMEATWKMDKEGNLKITELKMSKLQPPTRVTTGPEHNILKPLKKHAKAVALSEDKIPTQKHISIIKNLT